MAAVRSSKSNAPKPRKRVEAAESSTASLVRGKGGSAFAKCGECNKDVPVALISMHSCSLDAKIKMNLEAQVVEMPSEAKKPAERKRSTSLSQPRVKKAKIEKAKGGLKRPPTAFFIFMDDFRKVYKEEHPDSKGAKEVAKEGGERWRNMADDEKKKYQDKAVELKAEYLKAVENNDDEHEDIIEEEEDSEKEKADAAEKEKADAAAENENADAAADMELQDYSDEE